MKCPYFSLSAVRNRFQCPSESVLGFTGFSCRVRSVASESFFKIITQKTIFEKRALFHSPIIRTEKLLSVCFILSAAQYVIPRSLSRNRRAAALTLRVFNYVSPSGEQSITAHNHPGHAFWLLSKYCILTVFFS